MKLDKSKLTALAVAALLLAGGILFLWRTGFLEAATSLESLQAYIEQSAPYSHITFFVVQLSSVILAPIPSNITAAAGAVVFGLMPSFLLTAGAVLLGSVLVFYLSRRLGRGFADRFVSRRVSARYLEVIRTKQDTFLALAFLFPFFPDDLICILAGLTDMPLRRFFVIALLTRPWGLLVACAVGSSTVSIPLPAMVLLGVAGVALFLLGMKYGDKAEQWVMDRIKRRGR